MAYVIGPNGEKRPRDVVGNAAHCCRMLVGDAGEQYVDAPGADVTLTRVPSDEERKTAERTTPGSYRGDNAAG